MNAGSAEFAPFFSFFSIQPNSTKFLDQISRVHGLILLSMRERRAGLLGLHLDDEEKFQAVYSALSDGQSPPDFIRQTLGDHFKFTLDSSQHLTLIHPTRIYNLYPFFLLKGDVICW